MRVNPVALFTIVRVALATLPPEASVILPESVALMACPKLEAEAASIPPATAITRRACKKTVHVLRLTIHPQNLSYHHPRFLDNNITPTDQPCTWD